MNSCDSVLHLVLLLIFCSVFVFSDVKLCPVSTNPKFTADHDHLYPMEIYFQNRVNDTTSVPFEKCNVYGKDEALNFSCPLQSIGCPLIPDNLKKGLAKSSGWQKATSLCTFKSSLADPNAIINIFVFGGSVTAGVDTGLCCSGQGCKEKETKRCAWPNHFQHWLESLGPAKVTTYNFGRPGTSSDHSGERLQEYLDRVGVKSVSRNDIFFVDHSFNDLAMSSLPAKSRLERGLEKLIRRLLTLTKDEIPTIILMETDTRAGETTFYPGVYEILAKHYGLRIYSYLEATRSDHSVNHQKAFHHHLTHKHRKDDHPPWHTHLIYADFVSSLLLHEMSECDTTYKKDGSTPFVLPTAIYGINDSAHCSPHYAPLLRVSYDDIQAGTVIGDYSIDKPERWQVRLDRKGRGGIIAELNATDKFEDVQKSPIWFTLNISASDMLDKMRHGAFFVLQLNYMSSYVNSGQVLMDICGDEVFGGRVDSLWNDWPTYHYTTPAIFTWELNECKEPHNGKVRIGFKHWIDPDGLNVHDMKSVVEKTPRLRQLFKIISVMVCRYH